MKISCLKNELKSGLKPIDKFVSLFKKEPISISIHVEDQVKVQAKSGDYVLQVVLNGVEIQEKGQVGIEYDAFQQVLKGIRKNVMLSARLIQTPDGSHSLKLITPEGEIFSIPTTGMVTLEKMEPARPLMNLAMDELWQAFVQITRVVPKRHFIERLTQVKWVVSETAVRWVAVNQTELAIKHFQSFVAELPETFYISGVEMDVLKKMLSAISEQRVGIERGDQSLIISGEAFWLKSPIEEGVDIPIEKLTSRDMVKYEFSPQTWVDQINQELEVSQANDRTITLKQMKYLPQVTAEGINLQLIMSEETPEGVLIADELLKIFKQDMDGSWQCWLPQNKEPMIAFVKQDAQTKFFLYVITTGLN